MPHAMQLPTVGEIARRLAEPLHRIEYILRTRNIPPSGLAGNCRVYAEEDVERIAAELQRIDAKEYRVHCRPGNVA